MGELAITEDDVAARVAVLEVRGTLPAASTRAILELLREALEREVARGLGVEPTAADLAALDRHATGTSRDPATLARLREVLGERGFARQVLLPRVTSLRLRDRFAADPPGADAMAYDRWYRERAARVDLTLAECVVTELCPAHGDTWWLGRACGRAGVWFSFVPARSAKECSNRNRCAGCDLGCGSIARCQLTTTRAKWAREVGYVSD